MQSLQQKIESQVNFKTICKYLPNDHSETYSLAHYVKQFYDHFTGPVKVLDLGCGEGDSIQLFQSLANVTDWHGVDIENSPEVQRRVRDNKCFASFNGVDLPYSNNYFDLIYCNQVLEHVRYPDALLADAFRVLKPNGLFLGSVSYLEPFHSYSIFNFTPYGIICVFDKAGFELKEIRPELDASVLINRLLLNRSKLLSPFWNHNFIYGIIKGIAGITRLNHQARNYLKTQFSGHLVFQAIRPEC